MTSAAETMVDKIPLLDASDEEMTRLSRDGMLALNLEEHQEILDLFNTQRFIETKNENYQAIEQVSRGLEIIR